MARLSINSMRKNVKEKSGGGNFDSVWSPMGNMQQGDTAVQRLIPFQDELSGAFWVTQKMISLQFVNPENEEEKWTFNVPCKEMYVNPAVTKCPVANLARALFKEADELEEAGSKQEAKTITDVALAHWIRYAYYFQGFHIKGGPDSVDENTLSPLKYPKSMFKGIKHSIFPDDDSEPQLEELPTGSFELEDAQMMVEGVKPDDMSEEEFMSLFVGRNYTVRKTEKGGYNNYETSSWEMKETMLTDEQIAAIAENGLLDLTQYLPKQPSEELYELYEVMANVSIAHALGEGDGHWDPAWETEFGVKPNKGKSGGSSGGGSSSADGGKQSMKERMAARRKASDSTETTGSSAEETRAKLNASRGAPKEDAAPEETATEEPAAAEESGGTTDKVAAMRAKLAAKKAAAAA